MALVGGCQLPSTTLRNLKVLLHPKSYEMGEALWTLHVAELFVGLSLIAKLCETVRFTI